MRIKYLNWQTAAFILLIWFAPLNCQAQSNESRTRPNEPRLAGMRAMLFYETSGTFSKDVFTNQVNLWNTVMEGASHEGASESMLVVVEVHGNYDSAPVRRWVELTARYRIEDGTDRGKPAFFRKSMRVFIGTDSKFFAGFWLYQTGCYPVTLTARIIGQKGRVQKTINLGCGE